MEGPTTLATDPWKTSSVDYTVSQVPSGIPSCIVAAVLVGSGSLDEEDDDRDLMLKCLVFHVDFEHEEALHHHHESDLEAVILLSTVEY